MLIIQGDVFKEQFKVLTRKNKNSTQLSQIVVLSRQLSIQFAWFANNFPKFLEIQIIFLNNYSELSQVLNFSSPFGWNFTFCQNLIDLEIEDLKSLMSIPNCVNLSLSFLDLRVWSLLSSGLFIVKLFLLALCNQSIPTLFSLARFIWKSKPHQKVEAFA